MASSPVIVAESTLEKLREQIRLEPGTLYAILDACDEPRIPEKARLLGPQQAVSLYRGSGERDYWAIAPYLVRVDEALLDWIAENLWQSPWGVFAVAPTDLSSLRKHFRRFLLLRSSDGKNIHFRFYDPRVLAAFLPTCTANQVVDFFGPVRSFLATDEDQNLFEMQASGKGPDGWGWLATAHWKPKGISPEQMEQVARQRRLQFEKRLQKHLEQCLPEQGISVGEAGLAQHLELGVLRAMRYDIRRECDVAKYVEVMCTYAGGFAADRDPLEVQNFLYDRRVAPAVRLERLQAWSQSAQGRQYFERKRLKCARAPRGLAVIAAVPKRE